MKIINSFSKEDIELLKNINIIIEDKDYSIEQIKELSNQIYKDGFFNMNITYAKAEKYRKLHEKTKIIDQIDIEKVKKYTSEEFDGDNYMVTVLMHAVLRSNPKKINVIRKGRKEKLLSKKEYKEYEERNKEASKNFGEYMEFMKEKYGENLSAVEQYYRNL